MNCRHCPCKVREGASVYLGVGFQAVYVHDCAHGWENHRPPHRAEPDLRINANERTGQ
jgi:hypothetical protein